ncbi:S-locus lectin protein kinase family protein [Perilla frutescens var. hirtella]|uniref:Receptor-like serine/threonine-protein kinase n=1 Tax=Perilla frutescens var. hirtella TaxID=608512 RepID=A0AAD4JKU8_PERFH|nr:S-locus lectin protein kinase family protein [Perilla frutescens var. hirtella]
MPNCIIIEINHKIHEKGYASSLIRIQTTLLIILQLHLLLHVSYRTMNNIITCCISLFIVISSLLSTHATDTIDTSQIFADNGNTIISSGGSFELGFFSPENSKLRYVGIWYKKITVRTVVWVANRDNPVRDRSGWMRVVEPGHLVLLNGTNSTIWSTNTSSIVQKNPVAQLLDTGNLVVRDANDDSLESFLWQSFSYPTDTLLPQMKLGRNFITGEEVYIRSWKNSGDPASGNYTYHCDPAGYPQNVLKQETSFRFKTGPWNGLRFSGSKNLRNNTIFTFSMDINKNEVRYHYELLNDSLITRFTVSETGVAQRWFWDYQSWTLYLSLPGDYCDFYNRCGAHGNCDIENSGFCACLDKFQPKDPRGWTSGDSSNGCIRRRPLNCGNGDAFFRYSGIKLPDTQHSWFDNSLSLKECKEVCSKNCSCTAYSSLDISRSRNGNGCLLWFGDLVNMRVMSPGQEIYIRIASSELGSEGRKRKILTVTLSMVVSILLLCLGLLLYSQKRKKLDRQLREIGMSRLNYVNNHPNESHNKDIELPLFDLSTISKATDNFSFNNKLGEGGFGPVYKGLLKEGQEIAVKRLSSTSLQGIEEFKNEVICIAELQHRNLVKLLGCCIQGEEKLLVYEYLTNKSLDLILFDPTKRILLDWSRRFNIINGIARGLMYLHQDSRLRVIHRDLKASNILLDSDMNPKISDFGLARSFGGNETGASTSRVVGTYGYMSPEYARDGLFSLKSDVFSFGVIVLEIVSGKRNRGFLHKDHPGLDLLGHAWMLYREERSWELVDTCIRNSCYLSEIVRSIQVGLLCVQENPQDRPSMSTVVMMLSSDVILPEAKHPGFFKGGNETSATSSSGSSINKITTSLLVGR